MRVHIRAVGHNFWLVCKISKKVSNWISFQYKSYCCLHRRGQKVGRQKRKNKVNECGICHESITPKPGPTSILAPCCNGAWFHHKCVQTMALNHGNLLRGYWKLFRCGSICCTSSLEGPGQQFNTSYLTDSYISFTLRLESQQSIYSNRFIRSSTYGKKIFLKFLHAKPFSCIHFIS